MSALNECTITRSSPETRQEMGTLITLREYKARRQMMQRAREAGVVKALPAEHLWELLDRNIRLDIWKKDK